MARRTLRVALILWVVSAVVLLTWWQRPASGPSDELAHVVLFASLTVTALAVAAMTRGVRDSIVLVVPAVIGVSIASEAVQWAVVAGRSGSLYDVAFDVAGIAIGVLAFLLVRAVAGSHATPVLALISTAALLGSLTLGTWLSVTNADWWRCRGTNLTSLDDGRLGVTPGPVVEFDGATGTWRSSMGDETEAQLSEPVSRAVLCSAVGAQAFTAVAVFTVPEEAAGSTLIFGSRQARPDVRANFEIAVEGSSLVAQLRTGRNPRAAPRLTLPIEVAPGQIATVVVRYGAEDLTVLVNGTLAVSATVDANISAWNLSEIVTVAAEAPTSEIGAPVEFVAFYAHSVTNSEALEMSVSG